MSTSKDLNSQPGALLVGGRRVTRRPRGRCIFVPVILEKDFNTRALVDTGSEITIISTHIVRRLRLPITPVGGTLRSFTGRRVPRIGTSIVRVRCGTADVTILAEVANLSNTLPMIFGMDYMQDFGISLRGAPAAIPGQQADGGQFTPLTLDDRLSEPPDEVTTKERKRAMAVWRPLLEENARIPVDARCTLPGATLKVDTGDAEPVQVRANFVRANVEPVVDKKVAEWLRDGVIETNPTGRWAFPLVVAPKKDATGQKNAWRVCLDLRKLNSLIASDNYPIPRLADVFRRMHEKRYFTTLDMRESYHQIDLAIGDREKVAFIWQGRRYQFTCACFGLKTMTSLFQRLMTEAFADRPDVEIYVDDLTIHSATLDEHIQQVADALRRLNRANIRLNLAKCRFCSSWARALGHIISRDGRRIDPDKLKAVLDWDRPKTIKNLETFLGTVGWLREYTHKFAEIAAPLDRLRGLKGNVNWTAERSAAFDGLKQLFSTSEGVLHFPDFSQPFELFVDASQTGLGAYVAQKGADGHQRLISCASRALTTSERNYSATKRELLAVIWALEKFHDYLAGNRFVLHTDHKPLTFLLTQRHVMPMLNTWVDKLLQYDFEIVHVPGKENVIADALSRKYEEWLLNDSHAANVASVVPGTTRHFRDLHRDLLRSQARLPPEEERPSLLARGHEYGHPSGPLLFDLLLRDGIYWPTMRQDAIRHVRDCEQCQRHNAVQAQYHQLQPIVAELPWDSIGIDILSLTPSPSGENCLLVLVDYFTKFCVLHPMQGHNAITVARALWQTFSLFGFPKRIHSDRGQEFVGELMTQMCSLFGMEPSLAAAYNHQSNGQVERMNRTVRDALAKHCVSAPSWVAYVPRIQYGINIRQAALTGFAPFTLMFGRRAALFGHRFNDLEPSDVDQATWSAHLQQLHHSLFPGIVTRTRLAKEHMRWYHMHRRRLRAAIPNGAVVYARDPTRAAKTDARYEGPFVVVGRDTRGTYVLRDRAGALLPRHIPSDQIKLVHRSADDSAAFAPHSPPSMEVERILDHRPNGTNFHYLVQWKDSDPADATWVPASDFDDQGCIKTYWNDRASS